MRILLIAHAYPPTVGGVESHLWDLAHRLELDGHAVRCLVGGSASEERPGRVPVTSSPILTVEHLVAARAGVDVGRLVPSLLRDLERLVGAVVRDFDPDLVHLHNAHHFAPELAHGCFARSERPLVNSIHDRVGEHVYPAVLSLDWAHTLYASDYLYRGLPPPNGNATVLRLGIDLARFSPEGAKDPRMAALERPVVFHPSRLLKWKGVEVGLEAFIELRREVRAGTLVLCASRNIVDGASEVQAMQDELAERARAHDIADHVRFLEFGRDEMPAAYRASDLAWYPTTDEEPLGLAPLEAMASGTPLIVTDSGGMNETTVPGVTCLTVPRGDSKALFRAAAGLLADRDSRRMLVREALTRVQEFEVGRYTRRLVDIYRKCLPAGAAPE